MKWLVRGIRTSVGLKFVMAATGLLLLLFVIAHMLGNLQVYAGQDQLNAYAKKLQDLGPLLWVARGGLLAVFLVHVAAAVALTRRNRAARPVPNQVKHPLQSTYASRTMILSGPLVAAFVVYHLLHFTFGAVHPDFHGRLDAQGRHDVYTMVVLGFQQAPVAISYVVAMLILGLHLMHGVSSMFQSVGLNQPKYRGLTRGLGLGAALVIVVGNVSMPLAILFGLVGLPAGAS